MMLSRYFAVLCVLMFNWVELCGVRVLLGNTFVYYV